MTTKSIPPSQSSTSTSPTAPSEVDPSIILGLRWFLVGFALLGLSVGLLAGNSNSPVIGVVLPLLFGLVGGAGGFHLAMVDITSKTEGRRLRYLGIALIAFILPLLAGSAYGVLLRTGFGVSSLFPKTLFVSGPTSDALPLGGKNAREAIQLALMRARLRALATTESEQRAILLKIVEDQAAFVAPRTTAENLSHLAALIDQALGSMSDMPPEKLPPEVRNLRLYLVAYSKDLKQFASKAESGGTISPALVGFVIGTVKHDLDGKMDQRSTDAMLYLSEHDLVRQRLADLRWALFEAAEQLDGDPALNRPKVIQEVDGFLSLFSGDAGKVSEGVMVSKPHLGPSFAP